MTQQHDKYFPFTRKSPKVLMCVKHLYEIKTGVGTKNRRNKFPKIKIHTGYAVDTTFSWKTLQKKGKKDEKCQIKVKLN